MLGMQCHRSIIMKSVLFFILALSSTSIFAAKNSGVVSLISSIKGNPSFIGPVRWIIEQNQKHITEIPTHSRSLDLPVGTYDISIIYRNIHKSLGKVEVQAGKTQEVKFEVESNK